jgi:hypothetical protein
MKLECRCSSPQCDFKATVDWREIKDKKGKIILDIQMRGESPITIHHDNT